MPGFRQDLAGFYFYLSMASFMLRNQPAAIEQMRGAEQLLKNLTIEQPDSKLYREEWAIVAATLGEMHELTQKPVEAASIYKGALAYFPDSLALCNQAAKFLATYPDCAGSSAGRSPAPGASRDRSRTARRDGVEHAGDLALSERAVAARGGCAFAQHATFGKRRRSLGLVLSFHGHVAAWPAGRSEKMVCSGGGVGQNAATTQAGSFAVRRGRAAVG